MFLASDMPGNASSIHAEGRAARAVVEAARAQVAAFVGAPTSGVVFTSGATEALNLALTPHLESGGARAAFDLLLIGAGEHTAALAGHRFDAQRVEIVPLTESGDLDLEALDAVLAGCGKARVMLALQAANNETGVIQPVAAAAERIHALGGIVVCDAVQVAGKVAFDMAMLGADVVVLSAHKFGGPKGSGALCFAREDDHIAQPLVRGGGQERGLRAGTENVSAIAGFAAAVAVHAAAPAEQGRRLAVLRDRAEAEVLRSAPDAIIFGGKASRLPNTSYFAVPGIEAQTLLMGLDLEGVAVSSGAACSSGKVKRSHVLDAMGVEPDLARGAVRISFGWNSGEEDVALFGQGFEKVVRTIRSRRMSSAA